VRPWGGSSGESPTVRRLLETLDYSRKVNRKALACASHIGMSSSSICKLKNKPLSSAVGPSSVDTKKTRVDRLVQRMPGRFWCRDPHRVNVYDFRSLAKGIAIRMGCMIRSGMPGSCMSEPPLTPLEFAVDAIKWWWQTDATWTSRRARRVDLGRWPEQWLSSTTVEVSLQHHW